MRFLLININKEFNEDFINSFLRPNQYKEINGCTGGDNDYLCVDTLNKQWCYCEFGSIIFNNEALLDYQFKGKELRLQDLIKINY